MKTLGPLLSLAIALAAMLFAVFLADAASVLISIADTVGGWSVQR